MASGSGPPATPRAAPATPSRPRVLALVAWAFLVAGSATAAGCPGGEQGATARGQGQVLYVANSRDGTITRLDAASGRAVAPPSRGARRRGSWRRARAANCSSCRWAAGSAAPAAG